MGVQLKLKLPAWISRKKCKLSACHRNCLSNKNSTHTSRNSIEESAQSTRPASPDLQPPRLKITRVITKSFSSWTTTKSSNWTNGFWCLCWVEGRSQFPAQARSGSQKGILIMRVGLENHLKRPQSFPTSVFPRHGFPRMKRGSLMVSSS